MNVNKYIDYLDLVEKWQSAENAVSGDDGYYEKVDGSAAGLEPHPCAVVHLFC